MQETASELAVLFRSAAANSPSTASAESAGALPACDIPVRLSPSVTIVKQARSHGSGAYKVDAHGPVVGGRASTAVALLTIGSGRAHGERRNNRQSPTRTSAPLKAERPGAVRNATGNLRVRTTRELVQRRPGDRRPVKGPSAARAPRERSGQRPRRSGSLAAISAATAAWLGWTYRCRVASRLWPLMAISKGALTFASPRWVSREWRSWCRVLPPE